MGRLCIVPFQGKSALGDSKWLRHRASPVGPCTHFQSLTREGSPCEMQISQILPPTVAPAHLMAQGLRMAQSPAGGGDDSDHTLPHPLQDGFRAEEAQPGQVKSHT